jgi:hypothetical protein
MSKQRMKPIGNVNLPQEGLIDVLKASFKNRPESCYEPPTSDAHSKNPKPIQRHE